MIILDSTLKSLEVILGGAVTTNQLTWTSHWVDIAQSTFAATAVSETDGVTNNGTAVTMVAAPAASTSRQVKFVSVFNGDTASDTVTVRMNNNGTFRTIMKINMAVGDNLIINDE